MRQRLTPFVLLLLAPLVLPACAYKKEAKKDALYALECEPALVKVKKRRNVVISRGCGNEERYFWHCEGKLCRLNAFAEATAAGAFAADCPPEEMSYVVIDKTRLAVDGCDRRIMFESTLKGWSQQGEVETE
jgi:hypothetical protein